MKTLHDQLWSVDVWKHWSHVYINSGHDYKTFQNGYDSKMLKTVFNLSPLPKCLAHEAAHGNKMCR